MKKTRTGEGVDAVTRQVLGVGAYLQRMRPRSEAARERWADLSTREFLTATDRREELDRLRELDHRIDDECIDTLAHDLRSLPGLKRVFRRLRAQEVLRDADFFVLKQFLYHGLAILEQSQGLDKLPRHHSATAQMLIVIRETIHPERAPSSRFHLSDELDPTLYDRRQALRSARKKVKELRRKLEAEVQADLGGRFDIHGRYRGGDPSKEIRDDRLSKVDGGYRLTDDRLQNLQKVQQDLTEEVGRLESQQRQQLTRFVNGFCQELSVLEDRLVEFDLRIARVELRRRLGGCWPQFVDGDQAWLKITKGQEPALLDATRPGEVQPIDVRLTARGTVILGPNMGGKSALLRLVGLFQWCAQMALPVPAAGCEFSDVRRIVYIGSEEPGRESATEGLSSFGREVRRFVKFWNAESPVLWLLDEPGRGTHPEEGAKLAEEIAGNRLQRGDIVVMATHFPSLAKSEDFTRLRIAGLDVDDETLEEAMRQCCDDEKSFQALLRVCMDYSVIEDPDGGVPRDARRVARALGLDLSDI